MLLGLSICGTLFDGYFFAFHMLNIMTVNELLKGVVKAVTQNGNTDHYRIFTSLRTMELYNRILRPSFYSPPTKLQESNVFSHVCLSVCLSTGGPMWPLHMIHWISLNRDPLAPTLALPLWSWNLTDLTVQGPFPLPHCTDTPPVLAPW